MLNGWTNGKKEKPPAWVRSCPGFVPTIRARLDKALWTSLLDLSSFTSTLLWFLWALVNSFLERILGAAPGLVPGRPRGCQTTSFHLPPPHAFLITSSLVLRRILLLKNIFCDSNLVVSSFPRNAVHGLSRDQNGQRQLRIVLDVLSSFSSLGG